MSHTLTRTKIRKLTNNTRKRHIQESQEVIPFPTGDDTAVRNRPHIIPTTNTNNKKDPQ